jgi:hypothetical protein
MFCPTLVLLWPAFTFAALSSHEDKVLEHYLRAESKAVARVILYEHEENNSHVVIKTRCSCQLTIFTCRVWEF